MKVTVFASARSRHQVSHQEALAEGLRSRGHEPLLRLSEQAPHASTEYVACWGWRLGATLRRAGHTVVVMERGYLGDRFAWTSLGMNGLNGRATFPEAPKDGGERFGRMAALQPWRDGPGYALIVGQVPGDASLQGRNLEPWYAGMAENARGAGLEPVFRQHPRAAERGYRQGPPGVRCHTGSLAEALSGAAQVVTYNSNTGVDALLAGVPVYADNEGSMAWPLASRVVGDLSRPDRESWAHNLAWRQWSLDEIADGTALKGLLP